jgi:cyclophilin family peptidyl-prolyl cis-trans isomerase
LNTTIRNTIIAISVLTVTTLACKALAGGTPSDAPVPTIGASTDSSSCSPFDAIPASTSYTSAPEVLINTNGKYTATIEMAKGGNIVIELYASKAPITVNSFIFLACKGFYDGTTFHRVLQDFMAQGGDPTGTGMGGPGYEFVNENSDLSFDKPGVVAMANAGPDTNGSQFFITFGPTEWLDGGYTIFGQVIQGMDVVNVITLRDPDTNPSFTGDEIKSITISGQ